MKTDDINAMAGALPGAEVSQPFGHGIDVWKLGGKIFACLNPDPPGVTVKTDSVETAEMLIAAGVGVKAPYFHRSWVLLPIDADPEEVDHRLSASYRLIRASLPKKAQAALPPVEG